jgi:hypothetical protein
MSRGLSHLTAIRSRLSHLWLLVWKVSVVQSTMRFKLMPNLPSLLEADAGHASIRVRSGWTGLTRWTDQTGWAEWTVWSN